jgi:hypothetical protein
MELEVKSLTGQRTANIGPRGLDFLERVPARARTAGAQGVGSTGTLHHRLTRSRRLIPDEHVLVRVNRVLDVSWLSQEVADCYCVDDGRPGIDPEVAVRLMLASQLTGIMHDCKLMREA